MNKPTTHITNSLWNNLSVSIKFLLPIFFIMLVLFILGSWFNVEQQKESLNQLLQTSQNITYKNNQLLSIESKAGERKKAESIAKLLAVIMPNLIAEFDMEAMNSYTKIVGEDTGISYVEIKNVDGEVLSKYGKSSDIIKEQIVLKKIIFEGDPLGEILVAYNLSRFELYMNKLSEREKVDIQEITQQQESSLNSAIKSMAFIALGSVIILLSILWVMFKIFISSRLNILRLGMKDIAEGEGDLTKRIKIHGKDEIDSLGMYYNRFLDTMHTTIKQVSDSTDSLEDAAKILHKITKNMRNDVSGQQEEIGLVATAVYEMSMSIQEMAANATHAASSTNDANKSSQEGLNVVNSTVSIIETLATEIDNSAIVIDQVKTNSQKIGTILNVIKEISNQTNLLALNAAIEAARAGESGRGFAVVADEVRALASRTQQSTVEIQDMIEQLQLGSENAVNAMGTGKTKVQESVESAALAGRSFKAIAEFISQISDMNSQISSASVEQSHVAESVNKSITRIKDVGVSAAESTEHTADSSKKLSVLSSNLKKLIGKFKL